MVGTEEKKSDVDRAGKDFLLEGCVETLLDDTPAAFGKFPEELAFAEH